MAFYRVRIQSKPTIYVYAAKVADAIAAAESFGEPLDVVPADDVGVPVPLLAVTPGGGLESGSCRVRGEKRPPADIEALEVRLLAFLLKAPGSSIEEVGDCLKVSTEEARLPMKRLVEAGRIFTLGERRATRYHPTGAVSATDIQREYGCGKSSVLRWLRQGRVRGYVLAGEAYVHMEHAETRAYVESYVKRVERMPFTPPQAKASEEKPYAGPGAGARGMSFGGPVV